MANRCAMLGYLQLCGKVNVEGSNEQDSSDHVHSTVSQLIANYPHIIAVRGNNLNVGMYPDPGPRVQKRTSD